MSYHLVFDTTDPESPRLIELEDSTRRSISAGEWKERQDGYVELVLPAPIPEGQVKTPTNDDAALAIEATHQPVTARLAKEPVKIALLRKHGYDNYPYVSEFKAVVVPKGQSLDFDPDAATRKWLWPHLGTEYHLLGFIDAHTALKSEGLSPEGEPPAVWEYETKTVPRKSGMDHSDFSDLLNDGWEIDPTRGRTPHGWDRFDYHEEIYFRRLANFSKGAEL